MAPTWPSSAPAPRRPWCRPCAWRARAGRCWCSAPPRRLTDGLPTYQWYFKELTILNPRAARPRDCDAAIRLAAGRRLELAPLVTARFPLAQAGRALAASAEPGQLKVMLDVT